VRYCRAHLGRLGGRYTTADDVAQEVCIAVLGSLPRYRDEGRPFTAFVYGIAAHKVVDAQRAAARHMVVTPTETALDRPDGAPGPEQQAVSLDTIRRLADLLSHLSDLHGRSWCCGWRWACPPRRSAPPSACQRPRYGWPSPVRCPGCVPLRGTSSPR